MDSTTVSTTLTSTPAYFEESWSILSSIGLFSLVLSVLVIASAGLSPLSIVPPIISAACALANGLCYYAFYTDYNTHSQAVAAGFADVFWLIQEAGLSFYSYQILLRALQGRRLVFFHAIFWIMMLTITGIRIAIIVFDVRVVLHGSDPLQQRIDYLHVGYFICIAIVESYSSAFLIQLLRRAHRLASSVNQPMPGGGRTGGSIFMHLLKTTEMRMATLALIGITRAITYSFQNTVQTATTIASQLDRFVYSLECMFPLVMLVDILASKRFHQSGSLARSQRNHSLHTPRCRCSYSRLDDAYRSQEMPSISFPPTDVDNRVQELDRSWFATPALKYSDSISLGRSKHYEEAG